MFEKNGGVLLVHGAYKNVSILEECITSSETFGIDDLKTIYKSLLPIKCAAFIKGR